MRVLVFWRLFFAILLGFLVLGKLQLQVERINQLPPTKQQFVMQVIDSVLAQAAR